MVKIKFIGTGSLEGIPSPLCDCSVCNLARENKKDNKRFRSSIFLEFEDKSSLIIDCSPDFKEQLEKFNFPVENIFITHGHFDHFFGLGELSYLNPLYGTNPKIFGKKDVVDYCKKIFDYLNLNFISLSDSRFKVGKNTLELIDVKHAKNTSTSGLFLDKILIIPEICKINQKIKEKLKEREINLLIIDGAYYNESLYKDHFTIQEAIKFGKDINAKRIIITNIWHKTKSHEELEKEFKDSAEIAYDGLEVSIW
jgi:phosphoribosyl 1,2-cyclic phosphate phosphodiesterase